MPEYQIGIVEIAGFILGGVFAFAYLKFQTNQNNKEIAMMWKKLDSLEDKMNKELSDIGKSLARIEGRLSNRNENK